MHRIASLSLELSLELSPELRGAQAAASLRALAARLAPFERPGRGELRLSLIAVDDGPAGFLRAERRGDALLCSGDGLAGSVGPTAGAVRAAGGEHALLAGLRFACAAWLLERGGLFLHAACLDRAGAAHLFSGPSGAGKTTVARALAGSGAAGAQPAARVISDEVSAVRKGAVHGHPFTSRLGDGQALDQGLPLASISFLLAHGPGLARQTLTRAEAVRRLLPRVFLPFRDARSVGLALAAAAEVRAPAYALSLGLSDLTRAFPEVRP